MSDIKTASTRQKLRISFSVYGFAFVLVTDNSSSTFASNEFKLFKLKTILNISQLHRTTLKGPAEQSGTNIQ